MPKVHFSVAIVTALAAALLFGGSVPFAKQLVGNISPFMLAGLLYLGSGIGLLLVRVVKNKGWSKTGIIRNEWIWFFGSVLFGGLFAPVLLMLGLIHTSAADASLLLNLEAVFTALLAWIFFKENTAPRIVLGMFLIVAGAVVLTWPNDGIQKNWLGFAVIALACLCWAIDNNLTRKISGGDAFFIAGSKGLIAGIINTSLALIAGVTIPYLTQISYVLLLGFFGYGVSLVLFVLSLRWLGTARTSAYFSTAPFFGVLIAIIWLHEPTSALFWTAAGLMVIGIWLHLTEHHEHPHRHEDLFHSHTHMHDDHHQHSHDFPVDNKKPHSHFHQHNELIHSHPHYPDIHHRHKHK